MKVVHSESLIRTEIEYDRTEETFDSIKAYCDQNFGVNCYTITRSGPKGDGTNINLVIVESADWDE